MPRAPDRETVILRALGSRVRQDILELLGRGPATSSMLARALGSNTGVMSYHLRELGKAGLIEPDVRRGRSRYWRLSREDIRFDDAQRSARPRLAKAAEDLIWARFNTSVHTYLGRTDLPGEWRDAALFSQAATALTAAELTEFAHEYLTFLKRWSGRAATTKDARPVRIALFAYPETAALDEGLPP
jgi:DNA-binding transcriptional ArsR family regulator